MIDHAELSPAFPSHVAHAFTPIFGYYIADEVQPVTIRVNNEQLEVSQADRSDFFKCYPNKICKGFYAVFIANHGPAAVKVQVEIGTTGLPEVIATVLPEARQELGESEAIRARKRAFAEARMICAVCGAKRWAGQRRCAACETEIDLSPRALSAVPLGSYAIPATINTSCFGYGAVEQGLIDEVRARDGWVLDFGSGLHPRSNDRVVCLEIADMPSVDVVSIGDRIPFEDDVFDGVISQHVLEHVERPWLLAKELVRVAKPGAKILSTVPYVCPVHGFPYHFFNMTPDGLRKLFEGNEIVSHTMQEDAHPINGIKQLLQVFNGSIGEPFRSQFGALTVADIVGANLHDLVQADWARALPRGAWWEMPAHSTLVVRKL